MKITRTTFLTFSLLFSLLNLDAMMDTTIIEITEEKLNNIYYHQDSFPEPTRLIFPNLTSVDDIIYFHQNGNLISVEFPLLEECGNYFYFNANTDLKSIDAANLRSVYNYIFVSGNEVLSELDICQVEQILPSDPNEIPYYLIDGNTPAVDNEPFCFSQGNPTNLNIDNLFISENNDVDATIGILTADSNYPNGNLTFYLTENYSDNSSFSIEDNQLKAAVVFDYEVQNQYEIEIGVYNQLGESVNSNFTISIQDELNEDLQIIEITDSSLDQIYYHKENFPIPTKLIFTNLTNVDGYIYFHENKNLVEIEMPLLEQAGDYAYFYGNKVLEKIDANNLKTIKNYLHVSQNNALTELQICSLEEIQSSGQNEIPYYYIQDNTPSVDMGPFCFSKGPPSDIALDNNTIAENAAVGTVIANLSGMDPNPNGTLNFYLTEDQQDNDNFRITDDQLVSKKTFDFEVKNTYEITIGVYNLLGEQYEENFSITIEDIVIEDLQVVEVLDECLDQLYYHQENFSGPTKLVFPNLTTVKGIVYFHQNVNLVSLELPKLRTTGDYFYMYENSTLELVDAPMIDTIHNYLFVTGHSSLTELNICNLNHIISLDTEEDAYYYVEDNPVLDLSTTCLENVSLQFVPLDTLVQQSGILAGNFESSSQNLVDHYIFDGTDELTETSDFKIVGNGLFLNKELEDYTQDIFDLEIRSISFGTGQSSSGLNQRIESQITIDLKDKTITSTKELNNSIDKIKIYPNPVLDQMRIYAENQIEIILYDIEGNFIKKFALDKGENKIELSPYKSGFYYVKTKKDNLLKVLKL